MRRRLGSSLRAGFGVDGWADGHCEEHKPGSGWTTATRLSPEFAARVDA